MDLSNLQVIWCSEEARLVLHFIWTHLKTDGLRDLDLILLLHCLQISWLSVRHDACSAGLDVKYLTLFYLRYKLILIHKQALQTEWAMFVSAVLIVSALSWIAGEGFWAQGILSYVKCVNRLSWNFIFIYRGLATFRFVCTLAHNVIRSLAFTYTEPHNAI